MIDFQVGGKAVEVEDEGFEVEWGIEAKGELWRETQRKLMVPVIVWKPNRTSTLQHPHRDFGEVATASASASCSCSLRGICKLLSRLRKLGWRGWDLKGRRRTKEGGSHAIIVDLCGWVASGWCRIVLQQVLVYTVLAV